MLQDLGQIEYVFTDKTGTLTENRMLFRRCAFFGQDYYFEDPRLEQEHGEEARTPASTFARSRTHSVAASHLNLRADAEPPVGPSATSTSGAGPRRFSLKPVGAEDENEGANAANAPGDHQCPGLKTRALDLQLMSSESLAQTHAPTPQLSAAAGDDDVSLSPSLLYLHHTMFCMAICNTVVVSSKVRRLPACMCIHFAFNNRFACKTNKVIIINRFGSFPFKCLRHNLHFTKFHHKSRLFVLLRLHIHDCGGG